jgi:hypothetical protein
MREQGYECFITEHFARGLRHDLFGWCDFLALKPDEVVAVQVTSRSNVSARVEKITASATVVHVRHAGIRIVVHGWGKLKAGWSLREVDLS